MSQKSYQIDIKKKKLTHDKASFVPLLLWENEAFFLK